MFMQSKIKYRLPKDRNTAGNMGFAAMLAEEYILVDISLLSPVRAETIKSSNRT